jgi:hypothetical protein
MLSNLGRWFQRQCRLKRRHTALRFRSRSRPCLELLEDRVVPAVINVNSTADVPLDQLAPGQITLREAINIANQNAAHGDTNNTINLSVAGTYQIALAGTPGETDNQAGEFSIFDNATPDMSGLRLTIQNTSGGTAIIDGNHLSRVFDINANDVVPANNTALGTVTISGVTIENGQADGSGGGIRDQGAVNLTLTNDVITSNSASADGGGVSMANTISTRWVLTVNGSTIQENHAGDAGGGLETDGTGTVLVDPGTVIADNSSVNQGAGIWLDGIAADGVTGSADLTLNGVLVRDNTGGKFGGGIGNAGNGNVTITNSTVQGNVTGGAGGGFADQNNLGTLQVQNSSIVGNAAASNGGGIQEGGGTTITDSQIQDNAAGATVGTTAGTTVTTTGGTAGGSKHLPNPVEGSGGGLYINGGTLAITGSTISGNTATLNGGGIELQTTGSVVVIDTTIANNSAGNSNGGGVDDADAGTVLLIDDIIIGNLAGNGGGVFVTGDAGLTVQNTVIAQNIAASGADANLAGPSLSSVGQAGNLIGSTDAGSGNTVLTTATPQAGSVSSALNPQVTGLQSNTGPLAGPAGNPVAVQTAALSPVSAARGQSVSNGAATDERGSDHNGTPDVGVTSSSNSTLTLVAASETGTTVVNGTDTSAVTVTNTGSSFLPADNSTVTVSLRSGLTADGNLIFRVGALAAGQSATFDATATATAPGTQTITATLTSPNTSSATTTVATSVEVTNSPLPSPSPVSFLSAVLGLYLDGAKLIVPSGNAQAGDQDIAFLTPFAQPFSPFMMLASEVQAMSRNG